MFQNLLQSVLCWCTLVSHPGPKCILVQLHLPYYTNTGLLALK